MKTITSSSARNQLSQLIDSTLIKNEPIQITTTRGNVVLISAAHWHSIQETLHLVSTPGMKNSIIKGMAEPIPACSRDIDLGPTID